MVCQKIKITVTEVLGLLIEIPPARSVVSGLFMFELLKPNFRLFLLHLPLLHELPGNALLLCRQS